MNVTEVRKFSSLLSENAELTKERDMLIQSLDIAIGLLSIARCPDPTCDNKGTMIIDGEPQECEWCYHRRKLKEVKD